MVGATATRVDGWMEGWMIEKVLIATVDAMIGVLNTSVGIRIMRIKGQGERDRDKDRKVCRKTPKI